MDIDEGYLPEGHENDVAAPAPGDLEGLRSFLSLHDHIPGRTGSFAPSSASIARWIVTHRLASPDDVGDEVGLAWAGEVRDALRSRVPGRPDAPTAATAPARLDAAAREAGIELRFADGGLVPTQGGVRGAIGGLLVAAFLAELDGTWERLRHCANPECQSIFYDRSKNRSARWCSMRSCGNQAKVRAYRERHRNTAS